MIDTGTFVSLQGRWSYTAYSKQSYLGGTVEVLSV